MKILNKIIKAVVEALFPQRCIVCGKLSEQNTYFCKNCIGKIEPEKYIACSRCGLEAEFCDCDKFIYHFDCVASPFINEGQAKESFYSYKFYSDFAGVDYFAENMVARFQEVFNHVKIDLICYVPLSEKQLAKRGFDKCKLLAEKFSNLMNIPLKDIIFKDENVKTQHSLDIDNRFENTRTAYKIMGKVKGKTILLIDDIKTTGATLDACARELKFAGADAVYCLTALISEKLNG